jgi:hypothetical protein
MGLKIKKYIKMKEIDISTNRWLIKIVYMEKKVRITVLKN